MGLDQDLVNPGQEPVHLGQDPVHPGQGPIDGSRIEADPWGGK